MSLVAVIDYGSGNLFSVVKALQHTAPVDTQIELTDDVKTIDRADKVVFPGQGSPLICMKNLTDRHLVAPIRRALADKPFLGVCMGMQLLFAQSAEGDVECLNLVPESIERLTYADKGHPDPLRLPHIGWNRVYQQSQHPLWHDIEDGTWFYFVHSYAFTQVVHPHSIGACFYGQPFSASLAIKNIACVQFHPEKSAESGLQVLRNFHQWQPEVS